MFKGTNCDKGCLVFKHSNVGYETIGCHSMGQVGGQKGENADGRNLSFKNTIRVSWVLSLSVLLQFAFSEIVPESKEIDCECLCEAPQHDVLKGWLSTEKIKKTPEIRCLKMFVSL